MTIAITAFLPPTPLTFSRNSSTVSHITAKTRNQPRPLFRALLNGSPSPDGRNNEDSLPKNADALSAIDREYLSKVRARLFNSRRRDMESNDGASGSGSLSSRVSDHERLDPANLPDDLDAMDDILFDRAPANASQVRLFGAWLDDAVAGRKADRPTSANNMQTNSQSYGSDTISSTEQPHQQQQQTTPENDPASHPEYKEGETEVRTKKASRIFRSAMLLFNKGRYPRAAEAFAAAETLVGPGTRLGGQYGLWHAQARDAAGDKPAAARLLANLATHSDGDVRKVAAELHFIITAPKLQLDPGSFLEIPTLDESVSPSMQGVLMSNFGPLPTALVDKPPEPYTLQWYMEKKAPPKMEDHSIGQAVAVTAAIIGTLAYMAVSPHM